MNRDEQELGAALSAVAERLSGRLSIVDHVERGLRELILRGELEPGQRIVETQIARQLSVGQPAVREALKTLEADGLVIRQANRGCSVIRLSPADVEQIFSLRVEWESMAVRLGMEKDIRDGLMPLLEALAALKEAADEGNAAKFYHHDLEFHQTLWRFSANPFLERALLQITVPLFAFVAIRLATHPESSVDLRADYRQHANIATAIQSGDKNKAVEVTRQVFSRFWKQAVGVASVLESATAGWSRPSRGEARRHQASRGKHPFGPDI